MDTKLSIALSALISLTVYGCGDDDGGTGVSNGKALGELTDADKKKVCNGLQTKLTRVDAASKKLGCVLQGYTLSEGDAAECADTRDACIAAPSDDMSGDSDLDCDSAQGDLMDCDDVTVGELNDCADALVASIESLSRKITCSSTPSDLSEAEGFESPAECTKVQTSCPMLAPVEDDES